MRYYLEKRIIIKEVQRYLKQKTKNQHYINFIIGSVKLRQVEHWTNICIPKISRTVTGKLSPGTGIIDGELQSSSSLLGRRLQYSHLSILTKFLTLFKKTKGSFKMSTYIKGKFVYSSIQKTDVVLKFLLQFDFPLTTSVHQLVEVDMSVLSNSLRL